MAFEGKGSGFVDYQIANEPPRTNAKCVVEALEDDQAGTLTLNVAFQDEQHGEVQVGLAVFDYSPQTTSYADVGELDISVAMQRPLGGWSSESVSSVRLTVTREVSGGQRNYSGIFNAANLIWTGSGNQDTLAIKFGRYDFTVNLAGGAEAWD